MADNPKPETDGFDRTAYLKTVRQELLVKLGLPKDTKPEQVSRLLKIMNGLEKIKIGR